MVHKVTDVEDFQMQLSAAGQKLVIVDFFATWCGPCRQIAPILEQIAAEYSDKLVVLKVDVDENEDLTRQYDVTSMPTFLFIKNGSKVDAFSGASETKLQETIAKYISVA